MLAYLHNSFLLCDVVDLDFFLENSLNYALKLTLCDVVVVCTTIGSDLRARRLKLFLRTWKVKVNLFQES